MKTSELIEMLKEQENKYGDLDVVINIHNDYHFQNIVGTCITEAKAIKCEMIQLLFQERG